MTEYSKRVIRNWYAEFMDVIWIVGFEENIEEVRFVFDPSLKKLTVLFVIDNNEYIEEEFDNFGLTPYKELLSVANKLKKESPKQVKLNFVMEINLED